MGNLQDPRSKRGLKSTRFVHKSVGSRTAVVTISALLFVLGVVYFSPLRTEASVFSFISNMFSSGEVEAQEQTSNSRTMVLLQAVSSPVTLAQKDDQVEIVEDSMLSAEAVPVGEEETTVESDHISVYVVHKGDTLPAIAKMFGVSVNTIRWANDIKGNTITVGQTLVILPISGISHTVKKGDTLASIAKMHKGDLEEIMQYNNLPKNAKLAVGDVIIVPDGEMSATVSKPSSSGSGGKKYSGPSYEGYYMRPIIGGVKTQGIHGHNAVDLASYAGAKIMAAAAGTVLVARDSGWNGGYGDYVVIKHDNGTQTLYAHLSGTAVKAGDYVEQGDTIGYMGTTGRSTGIHLHFEIRGAKNPF